MWLLLVLGLIGTVWCQGGPPPDTAPKIGMFFEGIPFTMDDDGSRSWFDVSHIQLEVVDEDTTRLSGHVEIKQEMQHETRVILDVKKEASGRFETMLSHVICDLCLEIENPESDYKDFLKDIRFPEKCPFEPGEYEIHQLTVDTSPMPKSNENLGRYMAIMSLAKSKDCPPQSEDDVQRLASVALEFIMEYI